MGQTASGKTSLALELARMFSIPIISADAYQCYKIMQIGTDKPSKEEIEGIEYHFYDEYEPDENISVYDFQQKCRPILDKCLAEGRDILVVGGNFLYVKALLFNYVFQKEDKTTSSIYDNMSLTDMQRILKEKSEETYSRIDINNPRRVLRALIQLEEGTSNKEIRQQNDGKPIYPVEFYALTVSKEEGNQKIDKRIDMMVQQGLVDEVTRLYQKYDEKSRPFSTIGYVEIIDALKNHQPVDDKIIDLIKIHTHQYAKKQRTFLKHQFPFITSGSKEEIRKILIEKLTEHAS